MYARAKSYLVNISIIEGRHLAWPDMDSAVLVRVDNQKRCTKIARSTDCPYFNEVTARVRSVLINTTHFSTSRSNSTPGTKNFWIKI